MFRQPLKCFNQRLNFLIFTLEKCIMKTRREHDLLGDKDIPSEAWYGIQTQRAIDNFSISGIEINHFPELINALAMVKQAAAIANQHTGELCATKADAIVEACEEIIDGRLHAQFKVDLIQGGAGTSTNMNANEVIANLALEKLGHNKGQYQYLHPNNDVNKSQSTNDAYPTAVRLAIVFASEPLIEAISALQMAFQAKANEFTDVIKMARTQLQDAVPMTLGLEFEAFAVTLAEDILRIKECSELLCEVNLGGTAIGTGLNAHPAYAAAAIAALALRSNRPLKSASHLVEATSDMGAFVLFSSILKRLSTKLSKIANDLRLLASGPRAGLSEINLPPMQPGSSIMPGKVNPVIPEAVNQTAFQVIGNDLAVTLAAEAGQLQLNAMEPLIAYNILSSIKMLVSACDMFDKRCIRGISANKEHCNNQVNNSIGVITALVPYIGYENATRIASTALNTQNTVRTLVLEEALLDEVTLDQLLTPCNMIARKGALNA